MKKLMILVLAGVLLSSGFSGVSYAEHGGHHGGHHHGGYYHGGYWGNDAGWAAAGGLLGGMVLGAAIADSNRPRYYYPAAQPVYYAPSPYAYPAYPTYSTTTTYGTYYPPVTYVDSYSY